VISRSHGSVHCAGWSGRPTQSATLGSCASVTETVRPGLANIQVRHTTEWRFPCKTIVSNRNTAFEPLSKRRRGFQLRNARQARLAGRPRRQGPHRKTRSRGPMSLRLRSPVSSGAALPASASTAVCEPTITANKPQQQRGFIPALPTPARPSADSNASSPCFQAAASRKPPSPANWTLPAPTEQQEAHSDNSYSPPLTTSQISATGRWRSVLSEV
jgi:hypothetical protein